MVHGAALLEVLGLAPSTDMGTSQSSRGGRFRKLVGDGGAGMSGPRTSSSSTDSGLGGPYHTLHGALGELREAVIARFGGFDEALAALASDARAGSGMTVAFQDLHAQLKEGGGYSGTREQLVEHLTALGLPCNKTSAVSLVAFKRLAACAELNQAVVKRWGGWDEAIEHFRSREDGDGGGIFLKELHSKLSEGGGFSGTCSDVCKLISSLGVDCQETSTVSLKDFQRLRACQEVSHAVVMRWGTFDKAVGQLLSLKLGEGKLIAVADLHRELRTGGQFNRSAGELVLLLSTLGVGCNESSAITEREFRRLAQHQEHVEKDAVELQNKSSALNLMQVRRILMETMSTPEKFLARLLVALNHLKGERLTSERPEAAMEDLEDAVEALVEALTSRSAAAYAEAIVSSLGVYILIDVVNTVSFDAPLQLTAVRLLSRAVARFGGPPFAPRHVARQLGDASARGSSVRRSWLAEPPAQEEDGRGSGDIRSLEARFMVEVWWPLLVALDPEDAVDLGPLTADVVRSVLALFSQVRVPGVLAGAQGVQLSPDVEVELLRLCTSEASPILLQQALSRFEFLEEIHHMSPFREDADAGRVQHQAEVAMLAAALCGCRLLCELLAGLPGLDEALAQRAQAMLRRWRAERKKFRTRFAGPVRRPEGLAKLEALAKASSAVSREGYGISWPDASQQSTGAKRPVADVQQTLSKRELRALSGMDGIERMVAQRLVNREDYIYQQRRRPEEVSAAAAARLPFVVQLPALERPVALLGSTSKAFKTSPTPKLKQRPMGLPLEPLAGQRYGLGASAMVLSARG